MKLIYIFIPLLSLLLFSNCNQETSCTETSCPLGEECLNGNCVYITPLCEACGTYDGLCDGNIQVNLFVDSSFSNMPIVTSFTEGNIAFAYTFYIDISSFLGAAPGTLVVEVPATLNGTQLLIEQETYIYQGIASITLNGAIDFSANFEELNGTIDLSTDVDGQITFSGQRQ